MRAALAVLALSALPAAAQPVDCAAETLTPPQLSYCAEAALAEADAEMDETYRLALTRAKVVDEERAVEGTAGPVPLETALREAQAAFVTYRDLACEAEAIGWTGETGAPIAGAACAARLTLRRAEDLRVFGEVE